MWGGDAPGPAADMLWEGVRVLLLQDIPSNCVSAAGPLCAPGRQGRLSWAMLLRGAEQAAEVAPAPRAAR